MGHSFGGMLAVYFARNYPETTQVLALENPIGLEDYRSAIPPQPIEATVLTILGAMREATLYVARAEDHDQARKDAGAVMNRLIRALDAK